MDARGACRAGRLSREIFGATCGGFFAGFAGEGFAGPPAGLGWGVFFVFFCVRFFAAGGGLCLPADLRRDFAAAPFLAARVGFLPDFGLDFEAIAVQSRNGWPGIPAMSQPRYQRRVASASRPKMLKTNGFRSKLYSRESRAA